VRGVNNHVADALSRRDYKPTKNKTMEKFRLEETVYAIQKTTSNKITPTEAKIKDRKVGINNESGQYIKGRNSELICQIGKKMSYLLRHGSCNGDIQMDNQGYVSMAALLEWLNKDLRHNLDIEDITWVVDNNDKVRFSIDTIKGVKANYGHSLELTEMIVKEYREDRKGNIRYIVHETYIKYLPIILNEGLSRMERNHEHLCK